MKKFVLSDNDPISGGYLWRFFYTLALIFFIWGVLFILATVKSYRNFIFFPLLKGCHRGGLLTADREA